MNDIPIVPQGNPHEQTARNLRPEAPVTTSRLQALINRLIQSRYSGYAMGPDLSHYNENVNVQTLVDHGCSFLIHKIGDGLRMIPGSDYDASCYKDPRVRRAHTAGV